MIHAIDVIDMPKKIYQIVTNDEYELPVSSEIVGAALVADYLGITVQSVRKKLFKDNWTGKYKVVVIGEYEHDPKEYYKMYSITHDRSEYFHDYWRNKHGFKKTV